MQSCLISFQINRMAQQCLTHYLDPWHGATMSHHYLDPWHGTTMSHQFL
jgi:hypothetical protein